MSKLASTTTKRGAASVAPAPAADSRASASGQMRGADIVIKCLENEGVSVVFAYPGGASLELHQALTRFRDKIRVILPRHEQGGGFAAQGYASDEHCQRQPAVGHVDPPQGFNTQRSWLKGWSAQGHEPDFHRLLAQGLGPDSALSREP